MKIITKLILLFLLSISSSTAQIQNNIEWPTLANSDWPMIKHDPQFTGRSQYRGPQTPNIIWAVDMVDGIFSGPVIGMEGNLYFGSYYQLNYSDHFYCYTSNGNLKWDFQSGTNLPPQTGILIDSSNTIYFGSLDGYFYALNPDGTLKWKYETSAPIIEMAMPNIDLNGILYITNGSGELYSIYPDGTLNWSTKYENGFYGTSPVFSPDGKTIYITGRDSNLFALNLDGSIKWKFSTTVPADKAPLVDNDGNIYFDCGYNFYCLNSNGTVRWIFNEFVMGSFSMPAIDKYGNVYAIGFQLSSRGVENLLLSIDYNGKINWSYIFDFIDPDDFWQPLICDSEGTIYIGSTFGNYYYAISNDGKLKWKLPLNEYQVDNTGAIAKDGTLYLGVHKSSLMTDQNKTLIAIKDTGTVGVKEEYYSLDYNLQQNYPNPFNPNTIIKYQILVNGLVSLKIYDILGKEIATLVNEEKSAGRYEVNFNASDLASGVYIYRVKVNEFVESRKMVLMK